MTTPSASAVPSFTALLILAASVAIAIWGQPVQSTASVSLVLALGRLLIPQDSIRPGRGGGEVSRHPPR